MSFTKRVGASVGASMAPKVTQVAPNITAAFVHQSLTMAISGVGPLPSAAAAADKQQAEKPGDVKHGIHDVIENHVRYAGVQGFLTNLGGLVTMAVTVPANIAGLALIQCRMVAGILHLRGYDLDDPRTRDAILACLLGEEKVMHLIKRHEIPGTPMEIATNLTHDPNLDNLLANEVAAELIARAAGKRLVTATGRRIPIVGGMVGAGTDAFVTWKIGRYVDREFLPRPRKRR
ncbi:EcsC family protein [Marmoricola sp. RAF53]|uniref:EcsC family protein n=1 Tax=Marmoricola sp. RAF53 TaxID=3233059 RepID=UPI003F9D416C